jgi:hypothetical protein
MDKEIKEKWLKALRSGEYKQGRNLLYQSKIDGTEERYCCLGVLCDVLNVPREEIIAKSRSVNVYDLTGVGLMSINEARRLSDMNDSGSSFEEIAKVIEEEY